MSESNVVENRSIFLAALRSGEYKKGEFVKGRDQPPEGATGFCAIGLPYTLFCNNTGPVVAGLSKHLALTAQQISLIQNEWNDSPLTFIEIANKIEAEIFGFTAQDKGSDEKV